MAVGRYGITGYYISRWIDRVTEHAPNRIYRTHVLPHNMTASGVPKVSFELADGREVDVDVGKDPLEVAAGFCMACEPAAGVSWYKDQSTMMVKRVVRYQDGRTHEMLFDPDHPEVPANFRVNPRVNSLSKKMGKYPHGHS